MTIQGLPDFPLSQRDGVSNLFQQKGISSFYEAVKYVWKIPYGRIADRDRFELVLIEGHGACSSKHALLTQLAQEQGIELALTMGIFEMNGENTPRVAETLLNAGLVSLPEAHCFIRIPGGVIDVTDPDTPPDEQGLHFIYEERLLPNQAGSYKQARHRDFMRKWLSDRKDLSHFEFDEFWKIREKCIAALAAKRTASPNPELSPVGKRA